MTKPIEPTIGRSVWYRGKDGLVRAAIVTQVHGTFCVNLHVFSRSRSDLDCGNVESVTHAGEDEPKCFPSWSWMPYQLGQAAKTESVAEQVGAAIGGVAAAIGAIKDGVCGAVKQADAPAPTARPNTITREQIDMLMARCSFRDQRIGNKTTVVCCILPNGFEIIESSGCVDPANYNHALGVQTCHRRLVDRLWQLEGYRLQCDLARPV